MKVNMCALGFWLAVQTSIVNAGSIVKCGDKDSLELIPDPISENYTFFDKGQITIFNVDTFGEPVCCSAHIIIHVEQTGLPGKKCFRLSGNSEGLGYAKTYAKKSIYADYGTDGKLLFVPVKEYAYATGEPNHQVQMIRLRIELGDEPKATIE